jgi:hypothetical protein
LDPRDGLVFHWMYNWHAFVSQKRFNFSKKKKRNSILAKPQRSPSACWPSRYPHIIQFVFPETIEDALARQFRFSKNKTQPVYYFRAFKNAEELSF